MTYPRKFDIVFIVTTKLPSTHKIKKKNNTKGIKTVVAGSCFILYKHESTRTVFICLKINP